MLYTGGNHKILRFILLQHQPHALHIILGIAPISQRRKISQIELLLFPLCNTSGGQCNLTSHKSLPSTFRFMVKQDTRTAEHIISLTILFDNPKSIELSHCIRAVWVEWSLFVLRNLFYLTIQLRCRSLINATSFGQTTLADGFKNAKHTGGIYIGCKFRGIE